MSPMLSLLVGTLIAFQQPAPPAATPATARLQVFLDCNDCFADYLREATKFVDFVRDRSEADVHVIITSVGTGSGGREYVLGFTVERRLAGYSASRRRQLRATYAPGLAHQSYYEETIFGKLDETLPAHELSVNYSQTERWGSVEGEVEWFQYLNDLSKSRLEANGEFSWRIVRGLSISAEANASRIRDQLSLRSRGATPEEVLLRLRELQSGYEYGFSMSLTYTFGSIFSSIVNPRFGQ